MSPKDPSREMNQPVSGSRQPAPKEKRGVESRHARKGLISEGTIQELAIVDGAGSNVAGGCQEAL